PAAAPPFPIPNSKFRFPPPPISSLSSSSYPSSTPHPPPPPPPNPPPPPPPPPPFSPFPPSPFSPPNTTPCPPPTPTPSHAPSARPLIELRRTIGVQHDFLQSNVHQTILNARRYHFNPHLNHSANFTRLPNLKS